MSHSWALVSAFAVSFYFVVGKHLVENHVPALQLSICSTLGAGLILLVAASFLRPRRLTAWRRAFKTVQVFRTGVVIGGLYALGYAFSLVAMGYISHASAAIISSLEPLVGVLLTTTGIIVRKREYRAKPIVFMLTAVAGAVVAELGVEGPDSAVTPGILWMIAATLAFTVGVALSSRLVYVQTSVQEDGGDAAGTRFLVPILAASMALISGGIMLLLYGVATGRLDGLLHNVTRPSVPLFVIAIACHWGFFYLALARLDMAMTEMLYQTKIVFTVVLAAVVTRLNWLELPALSEPLLTASGIFVLSASLTAVIWHTKRKTSSA